MFEQDEKIIFYRILFWQQCTGLFEGERLVERFSRVIEVAQDKNVN